MSKPLSDFNSQWIKHHGATVKIGKHAHVIKVSVYDAIYPVHQRVISVYADPVNKHSVEYLKTKKILGDDWSTDLLESECGDEVFQQLQNQHPNELKQHSSHSCIHA